MSWYNIINGVTQATFFILPMLGKHPDEYPRFRDCFLNDEEHSEYKNCIHIYTRTGGGNRTNYKEENEMMRGMEGFIDDFDDNFDNTFASWIFNVPEKWKADYQLFIEGKIKEFSKEYQAEIIRVYPKLKEKLSILWN
jgi:hypothetical protein